MRTAIHLTREPCCFICHTKISEQQQNLIRRLQPILWSQQTERALIRAIILAHARTSPPSKNGSPLQHHRDSPRQSALWSQLIGHSLSFHSRLLITLLPTLCISTTTPSRLSQAICSLVSTHFLSYSSSQLLSLFSSISPPPTPL